MPLTFENPQERKRGTASRDNYIRRYVERDEWEWQAVDDNNEEHEEDIPVPPPVPKDTPKSTSSIPAASIGRRRRKKRKLPNLSITASQNEFCFREAAAADTGTRKRPRNHANPTTSLGKSSTEAGSAKRKATSRDTPMPAASAAASKSLVSPEDEVPKAAAPSTPDRNNKPKPGSRVLDVEYSPPGKGPCSSSEDEGETQMQSRNIARSPTENDEVDRLTSNNAGHSPLPYSNTVVSSEISNIAPDENPSEPMALASRTLAQVVQDGRVVTKQHFFSVSSHSPLQVLDISEPTTTRPFKGQVGSSPVHWSQALRGAGKYLLLTFQAPNVENDGHDWRSEGRRRLEWESNVLKWVQTHSGDNGTQLKSFPGPLGLQDESLLLCLNLTSERESSVEFDVLGTLEDLVHMHAMYNNGPIPETLCAHLVSQVLQCVEAVHRSGVTHNSLGLDSFLLVRRRKQTSTCDEKGNSEWFLVCTGLGLNATVCRQPAEDVTNEAVQSDGGGKPWRFKHDLYSVANIAHLLLSGGVALSCRENATGFIKLQSKQFFSSIYFRGKLAWEALFQTILNPPHASCCLNLATGDRKWIDGMTHARTMVENMLMDDETNAQFVDRFLDQLMEHVLHKSATGFSIRAEDRFPVKFIDDSVQDEVDSRRGIHGQQGLLEALKEKERLIEELRVEKNTELQEAKNQTDAQRQAKETFRRLADKSTKEMERALQHSRPLDQERLHLEQLAERQRHGLDILLRANEGHRATILERDRALSRLRRELLQSTRTGEATSLHRSHEEVERRHRSEVARLQAANVSLTDRLRVSEERVHDGRQETQLRAAQERIESLEATLKQTNVERDQVKAKLGSAKVIIAILEQDKCTKESANETSQNDTAALERLQAVHEDIVRQLREAHRTESSNQREQSEQQLADQVALREQAESRITELQDEFSRSEKATEAQSRNHSESVNSLNEEINRLGTLVQRLHESERQLKKQNKRAESALESERDTNSLQMEALRRRIQKLEASEERRRQRRVEAQGARQPREPAAAARRDSSTDGAQRNSSSSSQASVSRQTSRGPPKSSRQNTLSRRQQATSRIIPGQSLTSVGVQPQHIPSAAVERSFPFVQLPTNSRTGGRNGTRIVIHDPHDPSSDSDSDYEVTL